ncbi:MAG: hypothetical protein ABW039_07460 [Sphingobium sp.]
MRTPRLLSSLVLLLTGCAGPQQNYPSLAKRAAESAPIAAPAAPVAPAAPDPALDAQLAKLTAQVDAGTAAFDNAYARADRASRAASGAAVSSEAWVTAQLSVSALESARNDSVSALASLDTLYVERENAVADGRARGGTDAIDAVRVRALAAVDSQNDRIDALKGRLAQP